MKIADDDKIYKKLDQWFDEDDYDSIIEAANQIPREQWSNKLYFFVISSYNNKRDFESAAKELKLLRPFCREKKDIGKWYYMMGYKFYMREQYVLGKWCYEKALQYHPEHESSIYFHEICEREIKPSRKRMEKIFSQAADKILSRQKTALEESEPKPCTKEEFAMLLSYPAVFHKVPGVSECMGMEFLYRCKTENAQKKARKFLEECFAIRDYDTMCKAFEQYTCGEQYKRVINIGEGKIELQETEQSDEEAAQSKVGMWFAESMRMYMKTGIAAFDISEKLAILRICYACALITESQYRQCAEGFVSEAQKQYHSLQEYALAAFCGTVYFMFLFYKTDLNQTEKFVREQMMVLPDEEWLSYAWNTGTAFHEEKKKTTAHSQISLLTEEERNRKLFLKYMKGNWKKDEINAQKTVDDKVFGKIVFQKDEGCWKKKTPVEFTFYDQVFAIKTEIDVYHTIYEEMRLGLMEKEEAQFWKQHEKMNPEEIEAKKEGQRKLFYKFFVEDPKHTQELMTEAVLEGLEEVLEGETESTFAKYVGKQKAHRLFSAKTTEEKVASIKLKRMRVMTDRIEIVMDCDWYPYSDGGGFVLYEEGYATMNSIDCMDI